MKGRGHMAAPKTILVVAQKGGTGKTTICNEVYASLLRTGVRASYFDLDEQGGSQYVTTKAEDAEFQVIDTPGALQRDMPLWVKNADLVVVPTRTSARDIDPLFRTLEIVSKNRKESTQVICVLNQYTRWTVSRDFREWIKKQDTGCTILTLPQSEVFLKAAAKGISVVEYAPRSSQAREVKKLINAIREGVGLPPEK